MVVGAHLAVKNPSCQADRQISAAANHVAQRLILGCLNLDSRPLPLASGFLTRLVQNSGRLILGDLASLGDDRPSLIGCGGQLSMNPF